MVTDLGKNSKTVLISAIGIVTLVITALLAPIVKSNASNAEILQRLARLEECTRKIESVPEKVAALTEVTSGLRDEMGRMRTKLESHVDRGN